MLKFKFLLLKLVAIFPCHTKLTPIQQELIVLINSNLYINHLIVISDLSDVLNANAIPFVKLLSENKISVRYLTSLEGNRTMLINKFHPKILVLIETKEEKKRSVSKIFKEKNQDFLSNYIWAVFDDGEIENLRGIYVPYDCQFFVIKTIDDNTFDVFEIYHVIIYTTKIYKVYFGGWGRNKNLEVPVKDFYSRRLDVNKTILPVFNYNGPTPCPSAICSYVEIVEKIAEVMNFRLYSTNVAERNIRYEIYIGLFICDHYTYNRYVIAPIWKTSTYFHIKYDPSYEEGCSSHPYTRPFKLSVWIAIIIWILLSGTFYFATNFLIYYLWGSEQVTPFNFIDKIFYSWELYQHQLGSGFPTNPSLRIASLTMQFIPRFMMYLYSAIVISFVTVQIVNLPFKDLEGLIKDGTFKIGYANGTAVHNFFQKASSPTLLESQKFIFDPTKMPVKPIEGAKLICENPKFAYIEFNNDLYEFNLPCKILQVPSPVYITWDCFRLRDYSSYNKIFNRILKTFFSAGLIKRWERILFKKPPQKKPEVNPVKLEKIATMYALTAIIYFFSAFMLTAEIIHNWIKRKYPDKRANDLLFIRRVCMNDGVQN